MSEDKEGEREGTECNLFTSSSGDPTEEALDEEEEARHAAAARGGGGAYGGYGDGGGEGSAYEDALLTAGHLIGMEG